MKTIKAYQRAINIIFNEESRQIKDHEIMIKLIEINPVEFLKVYDRLDLPISGSGEGLSEAPRGGLGHWISFENGNETMPPHFYGCKPECNCGNDPLEYYTTGAGVQIGKGRRAECAKQNR